MDRNNLIWANQFFITNVRWPISPQMQEKTCGALKY